MLFIIWLLLRDTRSLNLSTQIRQAFYEVHTATITTSADTESFDSLNTLSQMLLEWSN